MESGKVLLLITLCDDILLVMVVLLQLGLFALILLYEFPTKTIVVLSSDTDCLATLTLFVLTLGFRLCFLFLDKLIGTSK